VQQGVLLLLIAVPLFNINKNFMALQTAQREQKAFAIYRSLRWLLIIGFIIIASLLQWEEGIYYSFLLVEFILFLVLLWKSRKYLNLSFDRSLFAHHLSFGSKSFIAELFSVLTSRLDIIILGYMLTQYETGVFSFYIFFVKSLLIFPGILQQNINPIIAKNWREKTIDLLENKLKKLRKINAIVILAQFVFILVFYSGYTILFKPKYSQSLLFLFINGLSLLPFAYIAWGGAALVMTGQLKANIIRTLIILMFSVMTLLILTSFYGLYGACLAVSVNMLFTFITLRVFIEKRTGIKLI
jgi:O-antigen/teichoic acid export membrane protein